MVPPTEHSDDLSSKFENFEYTPRPQVWERLESAAVEQGGGNLADKFEAFQHAPAPRVWRRIESSLYPAKRRRAAIWWAVAAGIALLIGWAAWQNTGLQPAPSAGEFAQQNSRQSSTLPTVSGNDSCQEAEAMQLAKGQSPQDLEPSPIVEPENGQSRRIVREEQGDSGRGSNNFSNHGAGLPADDLLAVRPALAPRPIQSMEGHLQLLPSKVEFVGRPMLAEKFELNGEGKVEPELVPAGEPRLLLAGLGTNYSPRLSTGEGGEEYQDFVSSPTGTPLGYQPLIVADSDNRAYRESFSAPIAFNFSLQKRLGKRWAMVGGLVYTQLRSNETKTGTTTEFRALRRRSYLGLAFAPRYHFFIRKHFALYTTLGTQFDLGLGLRIRERDFENDREVNDVTRRFPLGNQASILAGLGMDAALTQRLNLNFQLSATNYFYQSHYNLWSERINWPSAQVGLNLEL